MAQSAARSAHTQEVAGCHRRTFIPATVKLWNCLPQDITDYTTGLQMCKLDTLEKRRVILCTKFAHSMTTSMRTADLLPNTRRQEHGRNLRNSNKMTLTPCRTARFQNSPVPSLLSLLNTNK
ncbi:hypothetical protein Bbelb_187520 [Branchiostoma belcheri]|nr:hypothetical protein Bbelb_187520 [Branchiostoma belcheri]